VRDGNPIDVNPSLCQRRRICTIAAARHVRCAQAVNVRRPVPVVCAVIVGDSGRVLIAQRPTGKHLGLSWEFPGGKVESGEAPADALRREIAEELACVIEVVTPLPEFEHDYGPVLIRMIPFVCRLMPGSEPQAREHVALRWVTPQECATVDLAPADWPVIQAFAAR
jgi:8-oxo-dGTP diphosphatase